MPITFVESHAPEPARVLVAGAGVAAIELVLALRDLAGPRVNVDLLAPETHFTYRPLSVAEPFGLREPRRLALADVARDLDVGLRHTTLVEVDPQGRRVRSGDGERLSYDVLVVAIGARARPALPGALTFGGPDAVPAMREVVEELEAEVIRRVAFALPDEVSWALPLYELALLTSADLADRGIDDAEISIVTPEERPLEAFGPSASEVVEGLLRDRGIACHTSRRPQAAEYGRLVLADDEDLAADRVVALPRLEVPPLPGLPQEPGGFVPIDDHGAVAGLEDVYAAGDATTFPVKQGGLATQQADAVAAAIARRVGADVEVAPFRPVMRGVLLGGTLPHYLRADAGGGETAASEHPLWWPGGAATKVAGRYLAPYLARPSPDLPTEPLTELEVADPEHAHADRTALDFALTAADADAGWGDYESALKWLEAAEEIGVVLPAEYARKRVDWREGATAGRRRG